MSTHWKHKYFEKNSKELHTNIFRSLEIEQYLKQILKTKSFNVHNYKINFSNLTLNIFVSIYKIDQKALPSDKNSNLTKKNLILKKDKIINRLNNKIKSYYTQKKLSENLCPKTNYVKTLKFYKNYSALALENNKLKPLELKDLSKKMLESLKLFTHNNFNITLTITEINFINSKIEAKKALISFRKFEKTPFFKEGNELLIPLITQRGSAKLLSIFIMAQLRTIKRHNFFFNFLKESLSLIIEQKFSKIQGIKILIKGRINNAARSQNRVIKIGKIPLITIKSKIDYSGSTVFTSNGTLGVKVWICEK